MSLNVNAQNLSQQLLDNQFLPKDGGKSVPLLLDFTATDTYILDFELVQQLGRMSIVQTLYIDMGDSDVSMTVQIAGSGQRIIVKGRTQGYYTILSPNPVKMSFACPGGPASVRVFMLNLPIPGVVWLTQ